MPPPFRWLLALLPLPAAAIPAAARTCDEDDLALIEMLGGEWEEWAGAGAADRLDEAWLAELAMAAGCEWEATPGGAAEALERLRFRDAPTPGEPGAVGPGARFRPWWRVLLPRVELRWWSRIEDDTIGDRAVQGRPAGFEVWLLWSFAGGP